MKTNLLKIFAAMILMMTAFTGWGQTFYVGDLTYSIQGSTNIVYCTGLTTAAQSQSNLNITIPSIVTYNGTTYTVKGISANSFQNKHNIVSVVIRYGVSEILAYAFQGCTGLTRVRLPSSITLINLDAFNGCSALSTVYYAGFSFPKTVFDSAFPSNSNMNLYIPNQSVKTPTEYKSHSAFSKFANVSKSANAYDYYLTDGGAYCMGWPDGKAVTDLHSATLTGFLGSSDDSTYKPTMSTYTVSGLSFSIDTIGENAFQGQTALKTIDLTNLSNLKYFGSQYENTGVQNVTRLVLPNSNFGFSSVSGFSSA